MKRVSTGLLMAMAVAVSASTASATPVRPAAVTLSPGICMSYQPTPLKVGQMLTRVYEGVGWRPVAFRMPLHGLEPNQDFQVWQYDANLENGQIIGCAASQIGSVTTNVSGAGHFYGFGQIHTGSHNIQLTVSQGNPFFGGPVAASEVILVDVTDS